MFTRDRSFVLFIAIIYLVFSSACAHSPKKSPTPSPQGEISSPKEVSPSLNASKGGEKWWQKDETEWFFAALIVLGIGIAVGAAIYVAFGAGGLTIAVSK